MNGSICHHIEFLPVMIQMLITINGIWIEHLLLDNWFEQKTACNKWFQVIVERIDDCHVFVRDIDETNAWGFKEHFSF